MTITFKNQSLLDVIAALRNELSKIQAADAVVGACSMKQVVIRLSNWGTTTLTFSVNATPMPYLSTTLTLTNRSVAWTHKKYQKDFDAAMIDVACKAGGVVEI